MMQAVTTLTPEEMRALDRKPYVKIQWRQNSKDKLVAAVEKFPKAIATAFSPAIAEHFNTLPTGTRYIFEGASQQVCQFTFGWMQRCCREGAIIPYAIAGQRQFFGYLHIYAQADNLQISCLKNQIFLRLSTLAESLIQCAADVNCLYDTYPERHPMRQMIAKGTVTCFLTGKFGKAGKTYQEYFDETEEQFEDDVRRLFRKEMKDTSSLWADTADETNPADVTRYPASYWHRNREGRKAHNQAIPSVVTSTDTENETESSLATESKEDSEN